MPLRSAFRDFEPATLSVRAPAAGAGPPAPAPGRPARPAARAGRGVALEDRLAVGGDHVDRVDAGGVLAGAAGDGVLLAVDRVDDVGRGARRQVAVHLVAAALAVALDLVLAGAARDGVVAVAAGDGVVAGAAVDRLGVVGALEDVVAAEGEHLALAADLGRDDLLRSVRAAELHAGAGADLLDAGDVVALVVDAVVGLAVEGDDRRGLVVGVARGTSRRPVDARAAVDDVGPVLVRAALALERVVARAAADDRRRPGRPSARRCRRRRRRRCPSAGSSRASRRCRGRRRRCRRRWSRCSRRRRRGRRWRSAPTSRTGSR